MSVDKDPILSSSFETNFPRTAVLRANLADAPVRKLRDKLGPTKPTGVVGGPPCQGFSVMGRREKGDPRNKLLRSFFKCVLGLRPDFFVLENVPGLLDQGHRRRLESALELVSNRYSILPPLILDAANFGAATRRPRLIVVGYDANEMDAVCLETLNKLRRQPTTVRDAISDIPGPVADGEWARYPQLADLSPYAMRMRRPPPPDSTSAVLPASQVSGCQATAHTRSVVDRFARLAPGERDGVSKFPRLRWDRPAQVLRAGTGNDRGSYQAARPIHPDEPRVITVREAARLQGFPDWFQFHPTKWHSHRMIGNSVSPVFAEAIFAEIARSLAGAPVHEAAE